jgi:hypothetical protein
MKTRCKNCGTCQFFFKWKKDGRGLCDKLDASSKSDHGHQCKHWKAIPYDMKKKYRENKDEM